MCNLSSKSTLKNQERSDSKEMVIVRNGDRKQNKEAYMSMKILQIFTQWWKTSRRSSNSWKFAKNSKLHQGLILWLPTITKLYSLSWTPSYLLLISILFHRVISICSVLLQQAEASIFKEKAKSLRNLSKRCLELSTNYDKKKVKRQKVCKISSNYEIKLNRQVF